VSNTSRSTAVRRWPTVSATGGLNKPEPLTSPNTYGDHVSLDHPPPTALQEAEDWPDGAGVLDLAPLRCHDANSGYDARLHDHVGVSGPPLDLADSIGLSVRRAQSLGFTADDVLASPGTARFAHGRLG